MLSFNDSRKVVFEATIRHPNVESGDSSNYILQVLAGPTVSFRRCCDICHKSHPGKKLYGYDFKLISPDHSMDTVMIYSACPEHVDELNQKMVVFMDLMRDPLYFQGHFAELESIYKWIIDGFPNTRISYDAWPYEHPLYPVRCAVLDAGLHQVYWPMIGLPRFSFQALGAVDFWPYENAFFGYLVSQPRERICSICERAYADIEPVYGYRYFRRSIEKRQMRYDRSWEFRACPRHIAELALRMRKLFDSLQDPDILARHGCAITKKGGIWLIDNRYQPTIGWYSIIKALFEEVGVQGFSRRADNELRRNVFA